MIIPKKKISYATQKYCFGLFSRKNTDLTFVVWSISTQRYLQPIQTHHNVKKLLVLKIGHFLMPIFWYYCFESRYLDARFHVVGIGYSFPKPGAIPHDHSLFHWADNCMHFHIESNSTLCCRKRILNFDTSRIGSARRLDSFLSGLSKQIWRFRRCSSVI